MSSWLVVLYELVLILWLAWAWLRLWEVAIVSAWRTLPADDAFVHGQPR